MEKIQVGTTLCAREINNLPGRVWTREIAHTLRRVGWAILGLTILLVWLGEKS
jgi:hypothetical protein